MQNKTMHHIFKIIPALGLFLLAPFAYAKAPESPMVVDDGLIIKELPAAVTKFVADGKAATGVSLKPQLDRKKFKIALPAIPEGKALENLYDHCAESVVAITSVYKCGKCHEWHPGGTATGWILSADGIMVTNYHVLGGQELEVGGFGIRTHDGRFAPVTEILAASEENDVAIFKVDGKDFKPLVLGQPAEVGTDLHIIAHPDNRFYTYTSGRVSRYYKQRSHEKENTIAMAVTADFARGSSGGPVMNSAGQVVGMVASTNSIYYPTKEKEATLGQFQMVIHNCVPVSAIWNLIEAK